MARKALGPAGLAVLQAVKGVHRGERVLVACSGGADSLALAMAVIALAQRTGCHARAVVIDHALQPGSATRSAGVADLLESRGLATEVVRVAVAPDGSGLEAAARDARYAALTAALDDGERCYLGHTLDDQAETVLLGLARGSGLRSLAGMPAVRDGFVRPLLGLRRALTRRSCEEAGLAWWEDPHNAERRFGRARVRHAALPVLEAELGPGVAEALARTAALAREQNDALDAVTEGLTGAQELECDRLARLPEGLRHHVLHGWLLERGATEATRQHVLAVAGLVTDWHGQKWVDLPGVRVLRRHGLLVVRLTQQTNP